MEVFLSELAESKLKKITRHLLENWSYKVKMDFLAKLTNKIKQISIQPESCTKSNEFGGIYKCVVTKQTTFFYRINFKTEEIEIITLFDTRQDPQKIKKQLKK
ncbi:MULTISPECIES: type II toxin-antitoxin system RelE/ParE family toxin [unclassified Arenibacter]|uniref:type II toxin-antitoxin system RelE/ParE family toxin n=1 Tax=unclassified Arenibacter TaxID=2615047 RepID=UPI000E353CD3|nr:MULTISPECIES: type II toxin-antitoxin system RelE/ParE family toxin [unclassified Arenibacter]MCM4166039.1 type II toxin-antitoxin system RelE/ParE family toxin [Arenibacter sp. A80]RFT54355.1 type II toxin-antitoxin system RelE/ParE family toxin [Arenibacter sp. P308M17]